MRYGDECKGFSHVRSCDAAHHTRDDLRAAEWVHACDAAWLNQDWQQFERFMSPDVEFRLRRQRQTVAGFAAVVCYINDFMSRARITDYSATDLRGSFRSDGTGLIRYSWYLEWTVGKRRRESAGKDRLYLTAGTNGWLLRARWVWMEPICEL